MRLAHSISFRASRCPALPHGGQGSEGLLHDGKGALGVRVVRLVRVEAQRELQVALAHRLPRRVGAEIGGEIGGEFGAEIGAEIAAETAAEIGRWTY